MAKEIAFENGWISNFEELVTLTLHRVILHTVLHHFSTSTYIPNFTESKKLFVDGRTDVCTHVCTCTYGWTFETGFIRSTLSNVSKARNYDCKSYGLRCDIDEQTQTHIVTYNVTLL